MGSAAVQIHTSGADPPRHVPPPPPRPQKVGIDDAERYYDATPRAETASQSSGRGKDTPRNRLASAMRLGSHQ